MICRGEKSDIDLSLTLKAIFDNALDAICLHQNGLHTLVNPAYLRLFGYDDTDQLIGGSIMDTVAPQERLIIAERIRLRSQGQAVPAEYITRGLRRDGGTFDLEVHGSSYTLNGKVYTLAILRDVTKSRIAAETLRESEERMRKLFDSSPDPAWIIEGYHFVDCNSAAAAILGYASKDDLLFVSPTKISPPFQPDGQASKIKAERLMAQTLSQGIQRFEWVHSRADGSEFTAEVTLSAITLQGRRAIYCVWRDVTERKAAEAEIQSLAFYDPLTQLPNRRLLRDRLRQAMASSADNRHYCALLFIDLDNFKTLNDTLGHDIGDLLLQQVAIRLTACIREGDTVARLGGDEFVVMLEGLSKDLEEAAAQVEITGGKIIHTLGLAYQLASYEHHSTPSIGATLFADHQGTIDDLLKRADLAMYQAKAAGRNTLCFFDPKMQAVVTARATIESGLRTAIADNQLHLHYQPQITSGGRLLGAEALLRWQHPQHGAIPPAKFIPIAEETGLILPIGAWVLQTACAQLARWATRPETADLTLAVNVSARQFRHADFTRHVLAVIEHTGANPHRLTLELTESLLLEDVEETIAKMMALKSKGVGFSLDDFGTGYSSLSYLKRLPLDHLKIDQSFVHDVLIDPNDAAIARTIVALAQGLALGVIAEGVETAEQRDFLAGVDCHVYQGYLFSRPLPIGDFEAFAKRV
ncbi:Diguanylate cyclase/phosphodiesterase with PAS/PAC sensor(S) (fragment) [Candidatus Terasakiella magnetica]